jgi:hypothetical protein
VVWPDKDNLYIFYLTYQNNFFKLTNKKCRILSSDKGKPFKRVGRKTTGLNSLLEYGRRVAGREMAPF